MKTNQLFHGCLAILIGLSTSVAASAGVREMPVAEDSETYKVIGISDGDTLKVLDGSHQQIRVRLSQIDAPESSQAFGKRSRQELAKLCFRKQAVLIREDVDRYGRVVARVICDGIDTQSHMVSVGLAWVFDRYVSDNHLYSLQDQARKSRLGLWADSDPLPPWEYRARTK